MNKNNNGENHGGGGFGTGFLLGAIIGASLVFLFGTKKGKRLLEIISEQGIEGVGNIEDWVEEYVEDGYSDNPSSAEPKQNGESKKNSNVTKVPKPIRRFFRRVSK